MDGVDTHEHDPPPDPGSEPSGEQYKLQCQRQAGLKASCLSGRECEVGQCIDAHADNTSELTNSYPTDTNHHMIALIRRSGQGRSHPKPGVR